MTRTLLSLLAVLLALQIGITAAVYWPRDTTAQTAGPLLGQLQPAAITEVSISDSDDQSITLLRQDGKWQLEGNTQTVDQRRVRALLDALSQPTGYPVADTPEAQQRFAVTADTFQRRIVLSHEGGSTTVYLGSVPSFRKVHARAEGSPSVYRIAFNTFEAPATVDGWLDRSLETQPDLSAVEDVEDVEDVEHQ